MKKTQLYNDVSKELLESTKLKPNETVTYRLTGLEAHPMDPSRLAIPASKNVPIIDQIYDKNKEQFVDIAAVKSVDAKGEHAFHSIYFYGNMNGIIHLQGGRAADQEIHSYLALCNYNASNPNRDTSKEAIFELVDEGAKSEQERKSRNVKREALNAAADLSVEEVKNYVAAMGWDDSRKTEILRNDLESYADKDPQGFLDLINNKDAVVKAILNRALNKGVIKFDAEQSRFSWPTGEAILTVSRTTGGDNIEELLTYCISSAKGEKVLQTITSKAKK